jgi:hypothetical protein
MVNTSYEAWISRARSVLIEDEIAHRRIELKGKIERVGPCPKCGGEDRFSINTTKQVFNCRGCETGGDVIDLVRHLDGVDFVTACTTLAREQPPVKANGKDHAEPREVCTARFDGYTDENGVQLFQVGRIEYQYPDGSFVLKDGKHKKTFRQKRPDPERPGQWIRNVDGVRTVPYRLPELIEAISNDHLILIVEGEGKADLLWSWNIPATCNAMGAGKWRSAHSEFLRGADVVILPDNDPQGHEHANAVAASLHTIAKSVRILELPGLGPKQDIIDWAKRGGTAEQLHDLIAHQTRPWPLPAQTEPLTAWRSHTISAAALQHKTFPAVTQVVPGLIVEGLSILAGRPKVGKSWAALDICIGVADERPALGGITPIGGDVLYCALEDTERRLQSRTTRLLGIYGDTWPERLTLATRWRRLDEGGVDDVAAWTDTVTAPRLVVLDTLAGVRPQRLAGDQLYDGDYRALMGLHQLAGDRSIAVLVLHHTRKMDADDPLDTVSGTLGLAGCADTVLVLARTTQGTTLYVRGRDVEEAERAIAFDKATCRWTLLGDAAEVHRSDTRRKILACVSSASVPLNPESIGHQTDIGRQNVDKALARMVTDGEIIKVSRGLYIHAERLDLLPISTRQNRQMSD